MPTSCAKTSAAVGTPELVIRARELARRLAEAG